MTVSNYQLRICGLTFGYRDSLLFRGIDLSLKQSAVMALFGDNGVGKSTFLKLIAGILRPHAGSVLLQNRELTGLSPSQISRFGASLLLQGGAAFSSLSVEENLRLAIDARRRLRPSSLPLSPRLDDLLGYLQPLKSRAAVLLSAGERQILATAMTFSLGANLYLLDEPSASLSPEPRQLVFELIADTCSLGAAALLVEQSQRRSAVIADEICFMRLSSDGTVKLSSAHSQKEEDP